MSKQTRGECPGGMEHLKIRFAQWRAQKRGRGERIPEHLWAAAVEAARGHGVHAVSRALRLEYAALRRRVEDTAGPGEDVAAFVELAHGGAGAGVGCVVELEKGNGTRMRICVRDGTSVDWSRMKEAFLGA